MGVARTLVVRSAVLLALAASPALAQQPSPDQVNAIRSNCRSDFMSKCSGVTPGGADAIACLRKNVAQLSPSCQTAVNAIAPKPAASAPPAAAAVPPAPAPARAAAAPAPTPVPAPAAPAAPVASPAAPPAAATPAAPVRMSVPSADQVAAIRASCPTDFAAHCAGVPAGGMEGLACLQRNAAQLSPPCRFAVNTSGGTAAAPAAAAAPPPAAPAPVAAAPAPVRTAARPPAAAAPAAAPVAAAAAAKPPTAEQQAAIRASCRSDFMAKCSGVTPGGTDALACLKRNAAGLSPACGKAVSAIGAPAAAAATTAAPAAAAPPAAMPTAEQQAAIKRTCQRDFMMNCRGVQPGGPDAFACLQRNSARLSPDCRTSLAAVADPGAAASAATAAAPAARPAGLFPIRRAIRERMMGN